MPKAYLSEGEPEREPGQIALQACRLSACARASCAYVRLPVMSARLAGSPLGIYLCISHALMYKTFSIYPTVSITIAPLWRTARAASQEI